MRNESGGLRAAYERLLAEKEYLLEENARLRESEERSRKLEREVSERESRLKLALSQLPAIMWTTDPALHIASITGAGLSTIAVSPDALTGAPITQIGDGEFQEAIRHHHQQALAGVPQEFEVRWRQRLYRVALEPLHSSDGALEGVIGLAVDITDIRRLQIQAEQAQRLESIGRLAGGIAHDFNNILAGIAGFAELALLQTAPDAPQRAPLEHILTAVQKGSALVSHLLAFASRRLITPQPMNLNEQVQQLLPILQRLIGEDIELTCYLAQDLGTIRADPTQMEQVLINLVTNAREAMPQGGKLIIETQNVFLDSSYCERHWSVQPGEYVLLSITDSGVGIPPNHLPHLFEPFFTTREHGTGLGLAMVYGIIHQANGHIWVYSEVGKGTTFKIYLPRIDDPAQPITGGSTVSNHSNPVLGVILLVEDNPEVRESTAQLLRSVGYTVLAASDPMEALQLAQQTPPDLLITDVILPQMRGSELAERLLLQFPNLKVLYISGYTENSVVEQGELKPGVEFLAKPYTLAQLTERIQKLLSTE